MPVILRFTKPWLAASSPIILRFGDDGGEPPVPVDRSFGIEVGLGWHALSAPEQALLLAEHAAAIEVAEAMAWQGDTREDALAINLDSPSAIELASHSRWQGEARQGAPLQLAWNASEAVELESGSSWQIGPLHSEQNHLYWRETRQGSETTPGWTHGKPVDDVLRLGWFGPPVGDEHRLRWGPHAAGWICSNRYRPPKGKITLRFSESRAPQESPITLRFTPSPTVCEYDDGGGLIDGSPVLPPIDFKVPIQPQIRRTYIMQPTLTCHRVSDNRELAITAVRLSRRRGQWAWDGSIDWCSKGDALLGHNELLRLSINGYEFYLIAEQQQSGTGWLQEQYSHSCRGASAALSNPWRSPVSYTNTAQSFGGMLQSLLANTGWTVELVGVTDFSLPAGVFSVFAKDPIAAVSEAAAQVGAVVIPQDAEQKLKIVPRWPVVPWAMTSATPDIALHDSVIFSCSEAEQLAPLYNTCIARGEQQGISREIARQGLGSTAPAPDFVAPLIVDVQAAIMAGTAAIADSGKTKAVSIELPIMADLPPLEPGQLLGVTYRAELYKATVDSISISASRSGNGLEITQSAGLIRHLEH